MVRRFPIRMSRFPRVPQRLPFGGGAQPGCIRDRRRLGRRSLNGVGPSERVRSPGAFEPTVAIAPPPSRRRDRVVRSSGAAPSD